MFYGERIRLRATTHDDLPLFVRWLNDPEVIAHLSVTWPLSPEDEEEWFAQMRQRPRQERPLVIEVRTQGETWQPIGNCGFNHIDWRNRHAEVGIVIGEKAFWDQGYGSEALMLLLKVGFTHLNLHRIWLRVESENARAIAAYRKLGFVEEGRLRESVYRQGHYLDMIMMSVLRSEWDRRRQEA